MLNDAFKLRDAVGAKVALDLAGVPGETLTEQVGALLAERDRTQATGAAENAAGDLARLLRVYLGGLEAQRDDALAACAQMRALLTEAPVGYLEWALARSDLHPGAADAFGAELNRRGR